MRPEDASLLVSCLATSTQRRRGRGALPPEGAGDCDTGVWTAGAGAAASAGASTAAAVAGLTALYTAAWRRAGLVAGAALVACRWDGGS